MRFTEETTESGATAAPDSYSKIVIILIFLAGLSLLLYPFIANQWNNHRQKQLIGNYESVISDKEAAGNIDYAAEMKKAEAYNDALLPSILPRQSEYCRRRDDGNCRDSKDCDQASYLSWNR